MECESGEPLSLETKTGGSQVEDDATWDSIIQLCSRVLLPRDFEVVCKLPNIEALVAYCKDLQAKYHDEARALEFGRLLAFLHRLKYFHRTFDVLSRTESSPLWGTLRLCVELVNEAEEVFQTIVDMFDEIKGTIPRLEAYTKLLPNSPSLRESCHTVDLQIAEFSCNVIVFFRKNPLKNLLCITWKPFRDDFSRSIFKLRQSTRQIELEVQALAMQESATRAEEIKRLLMSKETPRRNAALPCFSVPRHQNPQFVDRKDILAQIQCELWPQNAPAKEVVLDGMEKIEISSEYDFVDREELPTDPTPKQWNKKPTQRTSGQRIFSLYGLGGVGKTEIALEYVYQAAQNYKAIFWLSADSPSKLSCDTIDAVSRLGIIDESVMQDARTCTRLFRDWLRDTDEEWLLVLDNIDDMAIIEGWLPICNHGSILMTSRNPSSGRARLGSRPTKGSQILPLIPEKGAELLLSLLSIEGETQLVDSNELVRETKIALDLVSNLGGLPLAINQMASYMLDADCDLKTFWEVFCNSHHRQELFSHSGNMEMVHTRSLMTIWDISISRISADGINLLHLLSWFDPESIPESLLNLGSATDRVLPDFIQNKFRYLSAVKSLLQQSLVRRSGDRKSLIIHRLVCSVTQKKTPPDKRQEEFDAALSLLYSVYPRQKDGSPMTKDWPQCRLYLPHVISLERNYKLADPPLLPRPDFATILFNACWYLFEQSDFEQSLTLLKTAEEVGLATKIGHEATLADIYKVKATIQLDLNKSEASYESTRKFLDILIETQSPDDVSIANGHNAVGVSSTAISKHEEALGHFEKSLEIRTIHPDLGRAMLGMTLSNLAGLEFLMGKQEQSLDRFEQAREIVERELGVGSFKTSEILDKLGNALVGLERWDKAFEIHSQTLNIRLDTVGDTSKTATSLFKLSWHLNKMEDYAGAEKLLTRALAIYGLVYNGEGGIGRSEYLMSAILRGQGRLEDSKNAKERAAAIRKKLLGIDPGDEDTEGSYERLVGFADRFFFT